MAERFDDLGSLLDTVSLVLDGVKIGIYENYTVQRSILTQPSAFSVRIGSGGTVENLIKAFPANTPFELMVGDTVVQRGKTDGVFADGGATTLRLRGRDQLAPLHDAFIEAEETFREATFLDLTERALDAVGIEDRTIFSDNDANRKAITGIQKIKVIQPPPSEEQVEQEVETQPMRRTVYRTIKAELGNRWLEFLRFQFDRAGLFLWAAAEADGFVLSQPNGEQAAICRLLRKRGQTRNEVNILNHSYKFETTGRYTEAVVNGRGGGGKQGRGKVKARFIDDEMVAVLNASREDRDADGGRGKRKRPITLRDDKVRTVDQARFFAQRKIAETRRRGFALSYTLAGHTVPAIGGGRCVWTPDTIVEIDDQEIGVQGDMWVESVEFKREPHTTTRIVLMRPEDLLYATEELSTAKARRAVKNKGLKKDPTKDSINEEGERKPSREVWNKLFAAHIRRQYERQLEGMSLGGSEGTRG